MNKLNWDRYDNESQFIMPGFIELSIRRSRDRKWYIMADQPGVSFETREEAEADVEKRFLEYFNRIGLIDLG